MMLLTGLGWQNCSGNLDLIDLIYVCLHYLLRFMSSKTGEYTSLEAYIERMLPGQEQIYYITGQSEKEVKEAPFVER